MLGGGILLVFLYFSGLAQRDLWSSHEARAAQNAQVVLEAERPILPRLYDGRIELQKPPLYYWLVAFSAWLRGGHVEAWDVRIPAAVSALATVLLLGALAGRCQHPGVGWMAGGILATMLHFLWLARVGRIDMPLTLACSAALAGYYWAWRTGSRSAALASILGLTLGVTLKGPIALALCLPVVIGHGVVEGIVRRLAGSEPQSLGWRGRLPIALYIWGLVVCGTLLVGYFWWIERQSEGQFARVFFWYHNLARGLGEAEELEHHPWWFYLVRMGPDLFPWSLLLPVGAEAMLRGAWKPDALARFGLCWFLGMTAFLSCMSFKRADYLLPAYPGAALILAAVLSQSGIGWLRLPWGRYAFVAGISAVTAIAWLLYVHLMLPACEPKRELHTFAGQVRRLVPPPEPVLLFRMEAHQLVFHLDRPVERVIEWENLDIWLAGAEQRFVIMTPEDEAVWPRFLEASLLYRVMDNGLPDGSDHEQPLVVLSNRPPTCFPGPSLRDRMQGEDDEGRATQSGAGHGRIPGQLPERIAHQP